MKNIEILSPAGNMEKLKTAIYFGTDAVYFAGKQYGLRAFSDNFDEKEIVSAIKYCHDHNVKAYITINIIAHNEDFTNLKKYVKFLEKAGVDAVIVSDVGIIEFIKQNAPKLAIHVSTQANVVNKYSAQFFAKLGVTRIVLARELSITEIKEIRKALPEEIELEAFVHGAMCISYSGRCLLSNYLSCRDSNRGACVQACRWEYTITEKSRTTPYEIQEDKRGTYILNSKDLNMLAYIDQLANAGVTSFKIEGRMKTPYYVATVTNAYHRAKLQYLASPKKYVVDKVLEAELLKASHRQYTTGFNFKDKFKEESECLTSSSPVHTHDFIAVVLQDAKDGKVLVEQRNRFKVGDELEVLSPNDTFNKKFIVSEITSENGDSVEDAKGVQQKLYLKTDLALMTGDILRKQK